MMLPSHSPTTLAPFLKTSVLLGTLFLGAMAVAEGAGPHLMQPRVPEAKLEQARALKNPLPFSSDLIEQGKVLYEGKGTCVNCHGERGNGKGPGSKDLNPPPRNFQHTGFWRHRTEGEIFWVIKYGSPGTAMIPFGGLLTDEEIWTIIRYEQSFSHGPVGPRGRGPRGGMGMGPHRNGPRHHQGGQEPCC